MKNLPLNLILVVIVVGILSIVFLQSCAAPRQITAIAVPSSAEQSSGRMVVTSASYFVDQRGYARDILVLHDTQTNQDYLAVMGAGVTEICRYDSASHSTKCSEDN